MKFIKKIPTTDKELSIKLQSDGWKKIKEPKNLCEATLISLPFAFFLSFITLTIIYGLSPSLFAFFNNSQNFSFSFSINLSTLLFVFVILVFMSFHEFIHAMFIPNFMKSNKAFWGINGIVGFVLTTEKLKKGRFIIISIMPYLLLSILLPIIMHAFGFLNVYTAFLCLINAMGSCVDFLNVCLIAFQVPNDASIINNVFETFYK